MGAAVLMVRMVIGTLVLSIAGAARLYAGASVADADLPSGVAVADVAQRLRINGLELWNRALSSELAPEAACALLERHWQVADDGAPPVRCTHAGQWLLVTHRAGRMLQTAQLEAGGRGSTGFLSEFDPLAAPGVRAHPQLPLPAAARVLNAVQSMQGGEAVTQFTLTLPWPREAALQRLQRLARDRGWVSIGAGNADVVDFQRGTVDARAIVVSALSGTTIVVIEHQPAGVQP